MTDSRTAAALATLEGDRAELRRLLAGEAGVAAGTEFPRSATFRWLMSHLNARSLAATALSATLSRPALLRMVGSWLWSRRRGRRALRASAHAGRA
ncbi:MAG TPA: hypothetical protein VL994_12805 [Steroidobacteraceae bacterium]|nr:hypothetical protein [Steroidobacteraceae bacterium]